MSDIFYSKALDDIDGVQVEIYRVGQSGPVGIRVYEDGYLSVSARLEPNDARRVAKWLRKAADAAEGKPSKSWRPQVGDRVEVLYNDLHELLSGRWTGPGTVSGVNGSYVLVDLDKGIRGGFVRDELRPIEAAS